jgi:hypothetical protein
MTIDFAALSAPFPPDLVSWRVGSMSRDKAKGMALAYIDARDVMRRLDDVCGPAGWQARYPHANGKTICEIGIRVGDEWVWKANGAGDTDIEAEKGAISDAFKRSAVMWGIGRYLYDMPSPWVAVNQYKQIEESEHAKLRALLTKSAPQARQAGAGGNASPVKPSAPADSPELSMLTQALKLCATPEAVDEWEARNAANIDAAGLSQADAAELTSRITRWRAHVAKRAAA